MAITEKSRRTLALTPDVMADMNVAKKLAHVKTDTKAMVYALRRCALFATVSNQEIADALFVWGKLKEFLLPEDAKLILERADPAKTTGLSFMNLDMALQKERRIAFGDEPNLDALLPKPRKRRRSVRQDDSSHLTESPNPSN